ncbi:MAG: hypothetical protein LC745_02660, partial [Planctomycetia bacterium]|nr:hypothetical protein [Planctomycetia bacterium]
VGEGEGKVDDGVKDKSEPKAPAESKWAPKAAEAVSYKARYSSTLQRVAPLVERLRSVAPADFPKATETAAKAAGLADEGRKELELGRNIEKSQWVGSEKDREKRLEDVFGGSAKRYKDAFELVESLAKETARTLVQVLKNPEVKPAKGDGPGNAAQRLELGRRRWDYVASKLDLADPVRAASLRAEVSRLLSGAGSVSAADVESTLGKLNAYIETAAGALKEGRPSQQKRDAKASQPTDFPGFAKRLFDLRLRLYQIAPDAPLVKKVSGALAPYFTADTRTSYKATVYNGLDDPKKAEALKGVKALVEQAEKLVDTTLTDAGVLVESREGPSRLGEILAEARLYKDRIGALASPHREPPVPHQAVERLEAVLRKAIADARSFREDEATAGLAKVAEGIRLADAWASAPRHADVKARLEQAKAPQGARLAGGRAEQPVRPSDQPVPEAMARRAAGKAPHAAREPIGRVRNHKAVTDELSKAFKTWYENYAARLINARGERPAFESDTSGKELADAAKRFQHMYAFISVKYQEILDRLTQQGLKGPEADEAVTKVLDLIKPQILMMRDDFRLLREALSRSPAEVKPAKAPEPRPYVPTAQWKADVEAHRGAYGDAEVRRIGSSQYHADLVKPRDGSAPPLVLKHRGNNVDETLKAEAENYQKAGDHPNIARCFGEFQAGGLKGLALEAVEGPSAKALQNDLQERLDRGEISDEDYWGVVQFSLARTLGVVAHLNQRGLKHTDIKP